MNPAQQFQDLLHKQLAIREGIALLKRGVGLRS